MLKHVIIERPIEERRDEFVRLAVELRRVMIERGWRPYDAWQAVDVDEGEPFNLKVGILARAVAPPGRLFFQCDFPDAASLEAQLHAMRNDAEVVRIIVTALDMVDPAESESFIVEEYWP